MFWGQNNVLGLKHLRLKFFQSKFFLDSNFFRPKIIVPKLYLKLEFDTEDQVLFPKAFQERFKGASRMFQGFFHEE